MVEASDLSELDEQDKLSVTSSMGFGRGNRAKLQLNVMRAVGRSSRLQFDSDLESSASRRGSIPKETLDDDDFHPLFYNDPWVHCFLFAFQINKFFVEMLIVLLFCL